MKLAHLENLIVLAYYALYQSGFYDKQYIGGAELHVEGATKHPVNKAIDTLLSQGILEKPSGYTDADPEISGQGIKWVEENLENSESPLSQLEKECSPYVTLGNEREINIEFGNNPRTLSTFEKTLFGTRKANINLSQNASRIPASDRTVSLTDNQVDETTKALEDFIQEFRQDHHFDNEWVAEKSALLKTLEAGKDYLENKVIDVRIGTMMTIEPLKEIVAKYDQVAVGGVISAMAQKLIEFLINQFAG